MQKKDSSGHAAGTDLQGLLEQHGGDRSDWQAVRDMSQDEVEKLADEDDGPQPVGWESTVQLGIPQRKQAIHMRLDSDLLDWFRAQGPGYQTRINAALRAFVQARVRADRQRRR